MVRSGGDLMSMSRTVVVVTFSSHSPTFRSLDAFFSAARSAADGGRNYERFTVVGDVDCRLCCARVVVSGELERSSNRVAWLLVLTVFANAGYGGVVVMRLGQRRRPSGDTAGHCRDCGSGIREAGLVVRRRFRVSSQFSFSRKHDRLHSLPPPSAWSVKVSYCTSVEVRVAR